MSKKVSEFNDASLPLSGDEFIPIVQNGLNRKTPISEIKGDVESVNGKTGEIVLNADDIDDGNTTNKFATDEQLTQIETNESDITDLENNKLNSITSGEPAGADAINNIVTLTQAEYDAGTPLATTIYIIT